MQTPRLLSVAAVIALCVTTFSTRADDTPAQAAARAALMQDMNETGNAETSNPPPATPATPPATPPPVMTTPPSSAPPMNAQTNMPMVATPAPATTVPAAAPGSAKNLVLPPVEQETIPTNQVTQYPVNPAPANSSMTQTNMQPLTPAAAPSPTSDQPISAPPLPISGSQQQQLQALLQQYVANQISPAQYQAERAKIMAGQ